MCWCEKLVYKLPFVPQDCRKTAQWESRSKGRKMKETLWTKSCEMYSWSLRNRMHFLWRWVKQFWNSSLPRTRVGLVPWHVRYPKVTKRLRTKELRNWTRSVVVSKKVRTVAPTRKTARMAIHTCIWNFEQEARGLACLRSRSRFPSLGITSFFRTPLCWWTNPSPNERVSHTLKTPRNVESLSSGIFIAKEYSSSAMGSR